MGQIKYNLGNLASDNYSTTETVVGQWIDGRDVYRKVLVITGVALDTWVATEFYAGNATIISSDAIIELSRNSTKTLVGFGITNGFSTEQTILKGFVQSDTSSKITFYIKSGYYTVNASSKHYLIVDYIKND